MLSRLVASGFRRRLTGAFILVAAATSGLLAMTSYYLIREYRFETFASNARDAARLSLLSAPRELSLGGFERLLDEYRQRGGFQTVVVTQDVTFSSLPELRRADIPADLARPAPRGELAEGEATVAGEPYLVLGGMPSGSDDRFYFFFSRRDVLDSIEQFRNVLGIGWAVAVAAATAFGRFVAQRTLRPVRAVADAAQALAEGLLDTRLPAQAQDEFGTLAASFNEMADALQATFEQLRRVAERERQFTSDVAHELRTPLAAMVSAASLIEERLDRIPREDRRPVELLVRDVRRLRTLVLELLELAQLDAGREVVHLEPVRLHRALKRVLDDVDGKGVAIEVPPDLEVLADEVRFNRVVGNLVRNALFHGGPPVTIQARRIGDEVVIEVLDRGLGIPDEHLAGIFRRFFKSDQARSERGAGLGLAIALENARLQGGRLSAANRDGGGARFTFVLPVASPIPKEASGAAIS